MFFFLCSIVDDFKPIATSQLADTTALRIENGSYPTKTIIQLVNINLIENEVPYYALLLSYHLVLNPYS